MMPLLGFLLTLMLGVSMLSIERDAGSHGPFFLDTSVLVLAWVCGATLHPESLMWG